MLTARRTGALVSAVRPRRSFSRRDRRSSAMSYHAATAARSWRITSIARERRIRALIHASCAALPFHAPKARFACQFLPCDARSQSLRLRISSAKHPLRSRVLASSAAS